MKALEINSTVEFGNMVYTFEASKVKYTIIQEGNLFTIMTARFRHPTPAKVMTLSEMTNSTKILRNFAALVAA